MWAEFVKLHTHTHTHTQQQYTLDTLTIRIFEQVLIDFGIYISYAFVALFKSLFSRAQ